MARLLHIATVYPTLRRFYIPLVQHFRKKGWQVDAMANQISECRQCAEGFDHIYDVEFSRNPLLPSNILNAPKQVRAVVTRWQYDIVHVHTHVAAFVSRYALRRERKAGKPRIIYTVHGFYFCSGANRLRNVLFVALEKLAGRWTDFLVVINQEDFDSASTHGIVPQEKIVSMPSVGLDTELYGLASIPRSSVEGIRKELGLSSGDRIILMIAEFITRKRHVDALRAFSLLKNNRVHLVLCGDGPLEPNVKRLASELGIAERVHFLGFRNDTPAIIAASYMTILPSSQEGLPRSLLESLSLEVPIVASNCRGNRDLVEQGTGFGFECRNVEELAEAMSSLLDNSKMAREMGRIGRKIVLRDHTESRIAQLHEVLYERALES